MNIPYIGQGPEILRPQVMSALRRLELLTSLIEDQELTVRPLLRVSRSYFLRYLQSGH